MTPTSRILSMIVSAATLAALFAVDDADYAALCRKCPWEGPDENQVQASTRAAFHMSDFGHPCYVIQSAD